MNRKIVFKYEGLTSVILCLLSIILSLYIGFWLCFIGGVVDCFGCFFEHPFKVQVFILGLIKILIAKPIGVFIFLAGVAIASIFSVKK